MSASGSGFASSVALMSLVPAAALALAAAVPPAHAARSLTTGFYDPAWPYSDPAAATASDARMRSLGAGVVRVHGVWAGVEPRAPAPGSNARDPANPAYDWEGLDNGVIAAASQGLTALVQFDQAPSWAEGPGRPAGATPGSWRPSVRALADLGAAAARRYSGHYRDPRRGLLPRVRLWQPWSEQNLVNQLNPQWERRGGRLVAASPRIYLRMLNAFALAVKRAGPGNVIVAGGTSPYGDPPGGSRMRPVFFWRELLCLRGGSLRPSNCGPRARFDALAAHPYTAADPHRGAINADDTAVADMHRLARLLRAAVQGHRVIPARHKRLWVTEFAYESDPPDPEGAPVALQARYLEDAFYLLWRQGVDTVLWFRLADEAPDPNYRLSAQSGVLFLDGSPKPSATAFRFPFVAHRAGGRLQVWGKAPQAGPVLIQRQAGADWQTVRTVSAPGNRVFQAVLTLSGAATLRAVAGAEASLPWSVG
jgi:hypothetical protein